MGAPKDKGDALKHVEVEGEEAKSDAGDNPFEGAQVALSVPAHSEIKWVNASNLFWYDFSVILVAILSNFATAYAVACHQATADLKHYYAIPAIILFALVALFLVVAFVIRFRMARRSATRRYKLTAEDSRKAARSSGVRGSSSGAPPNALGTTPPAGSGP